MSCQSSSAPTPLLMQSAFNILMRYTTQIDKSTGKHWSGTSSVDDNNGVHIFVTTISHKSYQRTWCFYQVFTSSDILRCCSQQSTYSCSTWYILSKQDSCIAGLFLFQNIWKPISDEEATDDCYDGHVTKYVSCSTVSIAYNPFISCRFHFTRFEERLRTVRDRDVDMHLLGEGAVRFKGVDPSCRIHSGQSIL